MGHPQSGVEYRELLAAMDETETKLRELGCIVIWSGYSETESDVSTVGLPRKIYTTAEGVRLEGVFVGGQWWYYPEGSVPETVVVTTAGWTSLTSAQKRAVERFGTRASSIGTFGHGDEGNTAGISQMEMALAAPGGGWEHVYCVACENYEFWMGGSNPLIRWTLSASGYITLNDCEMFPHQSSAHLGYLIARIKTSPRLYSGWFKFDLWPAEAMTGWPRYTVSRLWWGLPWWERKAPAPRRK